MLKVLEKPIDIAILVYFRFFAGLLFAQELVNSVAIGKFNEYVAPKVHFSYQFFSWLTPWPYWGMILHYSITIGAALMVAFGLCYRLSAVVLFLGYTSLFLMEMTQYINHIYLYCLISFWLIFLPLGKDELRARAPAWMLYLILFHMGLAYFFAGVAKLNSDWLSGSPMDLYLEARSSHPLAAFYRTKFAPLIFSWGGLLFDLLIVPALMWRRTRWGALGLAVVFHLSNVLMFGLATFPWFSLLVTSMFFKPRWPRLIPYFSLLLPQDKSMSVREPRFVKAVIPVYILVHLLLPIRHWIYPGNPSWTEEGHLFAWRMMLREKSGTVSLWIKDKASGQLKYVKLTEYLTNRQINTIVGKPEMILQMAHFLREEERKKGRDVAILASSRVSINGRPHQEMIKQGIDLASEERKLVAYDWILEDQSTKSRQGFGPLAALFR